MPQWGQVKEAPLTGRPRTYAQLWDREWLVEQYIVKQRSQVDIAAEVGCSRVAVLKALRLNKIPQRDTKARTALRPPKKSRYPQLGDAAWLRERYVEQHTPMLAMAQEIGCTIMAVQKALSRNGIDRRKPGGRTDSKRRSDASLPLSPDGRKRKRYHSGYTRIQVPDHPKADMQGYVAEHRWVVEQREGRYLRPGEVVHHIDGDHTNNDSDNLIIFPSQKAHAAYHAREKGK
jgi:hypothetical protein